MIPVAPPSTPTARLSYWAAENYAVNFRFRALMDATPEKERPGSNLPSAPRLRASPPLHEEMSPLHLPKSRAVEENELISGQKFMCEATGLDILADAVLQVPSASRHLPPGRNSTCLPPRDQGSRRPAPVEVRPLAVEVRPLAAKRLVDTDEYPWLPMAELDLQPGERVVVQWDEVRGFRGSVQDVRFELRGRGRNAYVQTLIDISYDDRNRVAHQAEDWVAARIVEVPPGLPRDFTGTTTTQLSCKRPIKAQRLANPDTQGLMQVVDGSGRETARLPADEFDNQTRLATPTEFDFPSQISLPDSLGPKPAFLRVFVPSFSPAPNAAPVPTFGNAPPQHAIVIWPRYPTSVANSGAFGH